jgi:hypothetical protein
MRKGPPQGVILSIRVDVRRFNGKLSALGHRIAGVDCEIDECGFQVIRIGLDLPESCRADGLISTVSPSERCKNSTDSVMNLLTGTGFGSRAWRRENARSLLVSAAARCAPALRGSTQHSSKRSD